MCRLWGIVFEGLHPYEINGIIFALVGILFLMLSLECVPKLYLLKFKCVNAQSDEKPSVKTEQSHGIVRKQFLSLCCH